MSQKKFKEIRKGTTESGNESNSGKFEKEEIQKSIIMDGKEILVKINKETEKQMKEMTLLIKEIPENKEQDISILEGKVFGLLLDWGALSYKMYKEKLDKKIAIIKKEKK